MTEDEAKAKWCPQAIVNNGSGYNANREWEGKHDSVYLKRSRCIASECMAWRRQTVMIDRATGEPAIPGVTAIGSLEERYSAHGYCGLAGVPA